MKATIAFQWIVEPEEQTTSDSVVRLAGARQSPCGAVKVDVREPGEGLHTPEGADFKPICADEGEQPQNDLTTRVSVRRATRRVSRG